MTYSEGLYLGYRGYDKKHTKPLYPFGFGLSYTTYAYSDLKLSSNVLAPGATIQASFTVTNTGDKAGFEVAQLYVQPSKPQVDRPEKELKGFSKVYLKPGESKTVTIALDSRSFAYYSADSVSWKVDPGKFKVLVGKDSESLTLDRTVVALYPEQLTTRDSNPPADTAAQRSAGQARTGLLSCNRLIAVIGGRKTTDCMAFNRCLSDPAPAAPETSQTPLRSARLPAT